MNPSVKQFSMDMCGSLGRFTLSTGYVRMRTKNCFTIVEVIIGVDVMYMYIQSALGPYRVQHSEKDTLYPRLSVIK